MNVWNNIDVDIDTENENAKNTGMLIKAIANNCLKIKVLSCKIVIIKL